MNKYTIDLSHNTNGMNVSFYGVEAISGEKAASKALNLIQGGEYDWVVAGIDLTEEVVP